MACISGDRRAGHCDGRLTGVGYFRNAGANTSFRPKAFKGQRDENKIDFPHPSSSLPRPIYSRADLGGHQNRRGVSGLSSAPVELHTGPNPISCSPPSTLMFYCYLDHVLFYHILTPQSYGAIAIFASIFTRGASFALWTTPIVKDTASAVLIVGPFRVSGLRWRHCMSEGLAAFLTVPLQSLHYVGSFLYMPLPRQSLSPRQVPDLLSETLDDLVGNDSPICTLEIIRQAMCSTHLNRAGSTMRVQTLSVGRSPSSPNHFPRAVDVMTPKVDSSRRGDYIESFQVLTR